MDKHEMEETDSKEELVFDTTTCLSSFLVVLVRETAIDSV